MHNFATFEEFWSITAGSFLIAWFVASVINQFRLHWWRNISKFDHLNLLPNWSFFAPNPGCYDFHLVYRDWNDDFPGPWKELIFRNVNSSSHRWIWNPARFTDKAVLDLVNGLFRSINSEDSRLVMFSTSYISLLTLVMAPKTECLKKSQRQFAIIATQGFHENRKLEFKYISERHDVQY